MPSAAQVRVEPNAPLHVEVGRDGAVEQELVLSIRKFALLGDEPFRLQPDLVRIRAGPELAIVAELFVSAVPAPLQLFEQGMREDAVVHHRRGHATHVHPGSEVNLRGGGGGLRVRRAGHPQENGHDGGDDREGRISHATMTVRNMPISMWYKRWQW